MIYPMQENIESIVDFERLKKANGLCYKWAQRKKVSKNTYIKFCVKLMTQFEERRKVFPQGYWSQLAKDRKVMFYAAEVEDILVRQYHAMIFRIFHILKIPAELQPDLETEGMLAIRSAVWHFRNHKGNASFTTFCYNAIFMRVRGFYGKMRKKMAKRCQTFHVFAQSDIDREVNFEKLVGTEDEGYREGGTIEQELAKVLALANLTENEQVLINAYINRHGNPAWSRDYRHKVGSPVNANRPLSKQATHIHLDKVQRKIFGVLQKMGYTHHARLEDITKRKRKLF